MAANAVARLGRGWSQDVLHALSQSRAGAEATTKGKQWRGEQARQRWGQVVREIIEGTSSRGGKLTEGTGSVGSQAWGEVARAEGTGIAEEQVVSGGSGISQGGQVSGGWYWRKQVDKWEG